DLLVIGTGLTMVDVVAALQARQHRGRILAISRRGLLPRAHSPATSVPDVELLRKVHELGRANRLLDVLRVVRDLARMQLNARGDWRTVIDALRPVTAELWQSLPLAERRRFVRHVRPWWDAYRHRMAPDVSTRLLRAINDGDVEVRAARVTNARRTVNGFAADIVARGSARSRSETFQWIVNCTGPDFRAPARALESQLLRDGLLAVDPLGLGFEASIRG